MPQKRKKTAQISLRIDPNLKEAAEKAAGEDHRSLTSLVEQLLTSHVRRRHVLSMSQRPIFILRLRMPFVVRRLRTTLRQRYCPRSL